MKRVFGVGGKSKAEEPSLQDVQSRIENRNNTVEQRIEQLNNEMRKLKKQHDSARSAQARQNIQRRLRSLLAQRKRYESKQEQLLQQQQNVDELAFAQEDIRDTKQQVKALEKSTKEFQKEFRGKALDATYVEDIQDRMEDLKEQSQEVQDILGRSFDAPVDVDQEEVLDELDALEDELPEELDEPSTSTADATPSSYLRDTQPAAPQPEPAATRGAPASSATATDTQRQPSEHPPPPQQQQTKVDEYGLPVTSQ